jgi:flavin reductase (DIM6/NTAB) family NADH-FMN oxidoreductase RutF
MIRRPIEIEHFRADIHRLWDEQWFVLTAGDFVHGRYNSMTVSWGSLGILWNKPLAMVVVRPTRHTHGFMERSESFTLCAFSETYRAALNILGSKSGRDGDKIKEAGLTPEASQLVAAPGFAEAELILECRKIYWQDMDPSHFLVPEIERNYPQKDYHRIYFGEVLGIFGEEKYRV